MSWSTFLHKIFPYSCFCLLAARIRHNLLTLSINGFKWLCFWQVWWISFCLHLFYPSKLDESYERYWYCSESWDSLKITHLKGLKNIWIYFLIFYIILFVNAPTKKNSFSRSVNYEVYCNTLLASRFILSNNLITGNVHTAYRRLDYTCVV